MSQASDVMNGAFPVVTDPLGEALHGLRMSGALYCRSELSAPWGMELPAMPGCLMFHLVTEGVAWIEAEGEEPLRVEPGMLVMIPHGQGHRVVHEPGAEAVGLFELDRVMLSERYEVLRIDGGGAGGGAGRGERCGMMCGAVCFEDAVATRLVGLLPRTMVVGGEDHSERGAVVARMRGMLEMIAAEVEVLRPGGETIVARLADILIIDAIRHWMATDTRAHRGWLGALQDGQIGRALSAVHRDPKRAWSVAELAEAVAMSRSAFAARFAELVGQTPMQYVRDWKMSQGKAWLATGGVTVSEVAYRLGYESEASFSRAFKGVTGRSPGAVGAVGAVGD
ncbi:MAG: AraC family transcriptional regulator [Planctomycetota bacterium]